MFYFKTVLASIALWFGYQRLTMPVVSQIHHEDLFKDFAHIFLGTLLGISLYATLVWLRMRVSLNRLRRQYAVDTATLITMGDKLDDEKCVVWFFWAMTIGLTILEVVAFKIHEAPV